MALSGGSLRAFVLALGFVLLASFAHQPRASAAAPSAIRDTEIENDIRTLASPIWRVAGLDPADVGIYLIDDDQINSFVAGGQAIFINTGLIERAETPGQLIGVIAHETGHIVGGHILRTKEEMHNASIETIIAMVLAAGASVAGRSGAPRLGAGGSASATFCNSRSPRRRRPTTPRSTFSIALASRHAASSSFSRFSKAANYRPARAGISGPAPIH